VAAILEQAMTYGIDDVSRLPVGVSFKFSQQFVVFFWRKHAEV